jgi:hypothetical protein
VTTSLGRASLALIALLPAVASACSTSAGQDAPSITSKLELDAPLEAETFFDFPYPSDVRVTEGGRPDLAGFPNAGKAAFEGLRKGAAERTGFPVIATAFFRFTGKLAARKSTDVIAASADSPILLVDTDEASPERGKLFPVVALTPEADAYTPENLLAVGARPGIVLHPRRTYAFVVRSTVGVEGGGRAGAPRALAEALEGRAVAGARGARASAGYAKLGATLKKLGVPTSDVAAATVFTTGDVVAENADLAKRLAAKKGAEITGLALEPDPDGLFPRFCHVKGTITFPQYQTGKPPFDTGGTFEIGEGGLPIQQREETAQVSLTFPKQPMPAGGYPLVVYFHGSGGVAREHVDGGDKGTREDAMRWPAHVLAGQGFAMAGSSLPASPDRWPGADAFAYLNLNNPVALRDTFRQGIVEQRIFFDALARLSVPKEVLAGCAGATLPAGEAAFRYSLDRLTAQGQSMGGMYTNLIGATEPRIGAVVPTGAGGYWTYFVLQTPKVPGAGTLLGLFLGTQQKLDALHPAMSITEAALEPVDPLASVPRLARRPLDGHPVRPIYEPVGKDDSYFPTPIYDAMAIGYGHPRAGDEVWPTLGEAQSLIGLKEPVTYPLRGNAKSETGASYTGVVVMVAPPAGTDGHSVYRRVDGVMHQYACFHGSFHRTGAASVVAPGPLDSPCPE